MNKNAQALIKTLNLSKHPEGGYFKETYRSAGKINEASLSPLYEGSRNYSTCIYFLLTSGEFSAFHKINQDEIWHYYKGSTLQLHIMSPEGEYSKINIGNTISKGEVPQFVVPGGYYFGANIEKENSYVLVGCTVAPGFDFADFELTKKEVLLKKFPQHSKIIEKLTR